MRYAVALALLAAMPITGGAQNIELKKGQPPDLTAWLQVQGIAGKHAEDRAGRVKVQFQWNARSPLQSDPRK